MQTKPEIISQIIGSTCWRPWRGYRSALFFEFGEKFDDRNGGELRRGTYTIGLSCPWQVFENSSLLFNSKTDFDEMDRLQKKFTDQKLIDITFDSELHEESIIFSNGLVVQTYHNVPHEEWHILTAGTSYVFYGDRVESISEK